VAGGGKALGSQQTALSNSAVNPEELAERIATDMLAAGLEVIVGLHQRHAHAAPTIDYRWATGPRSAGSPPQAPVPADPIEWAAAVVCIVGAKTDASEVRNSVISNTQTADASVDTCAHHRPHDTLA
jgi:hypothetical protein